MLFRSPDAFARRTSEATIAEQLSEVLVRAGLPQPVPADNDRVGGWMMMYQLLESDGWLIADHCQELVRTLPLLTRDDTNIEDIFKMAGDDPADAARYGLKSRLAGRAGQAPLAQRIAAQVTATDPTSRAIQIRRALLAEQRRLDRKSVV